jgi:predicted nucleic acid-binding protein
MSERGPVVSDASPLIALERIGRLDLLADLFGSIAIPEAVAREVFAEYPCARSSLSQDTRRFPPWPFLAIM